MDLTKLNFGVDGDSITAWQQWSYHVYKELGFASHYNVAVGSSVWYKRHITGDGWEVTTQNYTDPDFAGISGGWEPTDDPLEMQMRANNCAVVHIQQYLEDVKSGKAPVPDVFAFAMGTNDSLECLGSPEEALSGKTLDDVDLFTEAGAVRWCIQRIMEEFPDCRVFVLTPIQAADPQHNRKNFECIKVIKAVAQGMSAQIVDCYTGCGICEKFETEGGEGRYLRDGLHPKENGQALQGAFAAKEIKNNLFYAPKA